MEYRQLGGTGLQVSAIGLGTNNFGGRMDAGATATVVNHALEHGINFIDTSNSYGSTLSEEYIGRALKGKRQEAIIATKVGSRLQEGVNRLGLSRKHIMDEIDNSLRRLQTDYLDLYQTHWTDVDTPIEETLRALDDLVRQGKTRYVGCSNVAAWRVCEGFLTSESLGLHTYASVQPQYNMLYRAAEPELVPFCEEYGVGILPYYPLASGFLTGKYRRGEAPAEGTRLAQGDRGMLTEDNYVRLEALEKFASERGHTILELAFAYLLAHGPVSSVIAGATKKEQIESNAAAHAWHLSDEELTEVQGILDAFQPLETVERMLPQ